MGENELDSLTEFLRAPPNDSLYEVAPELRVSHGFMSLACAFEEIFSLFANYPKGIGEVFCQWIMDDNFGELLFHVERAASGGRQDVVSIAATAIFWNRNYCVEFLDDMIRCCSKSENILALNPIILLFSLRL